MNAKIDIPQFLKDQLRKQTISPDPQKQRQVNFHRRLTSSQIETSNKKLNNKSSKLQQLLKTSPYSKLMQQKSYSQMLVQDSFSRQYLKDSTPNQQSSQNFFNKGGANSQNSTMCSSVKPRMRSANKEFKKAINETTQLFSHRDKETVLQLQQILVRTNSLLLQYQSEIQRHVQEKEELIKYIQNLQSS